MATKPTGYRVLDERLKRLEKQQNADHMLVTQHQTAIRELQSEVAKVLKAIREKGAKR